MRLPRNREGLPNNSAGAWITRTSPATPLRAFPECAQALEGRRLRLSRNQCAPPSTPVMPNKFVDLTLEWPRIGILDESVTLGILPNIGPFRVVIFSAPHLAVPEASLPNRLLQSGTPISGDKAFPTRHPASQPKSSAQCRRAEQMKVIRQHDIFSCRPMLRREPGFEQKLYDKAIGEYRFSIFRANREGWMSAI